ncbi:HAMP domain-containing sensor histidine kinase [Mesobacterium sp. TK19101]|uniref:histidine kinase n=1 Tax=Mesobacterium hydrothermale TaxID=3111907 RepID=A0ABU6HM68_9RHOB|nr:HAMP domain-containing sensor histidine kinase [Mesobacterium sp. TK19101]MEC3862553.1 HAMP domain-containing sensor histidine kinase [Mesobacterium sp. TK19101]
MDRGDVLSGAAFAAVLQSSFVFLLVMAAMAVFSLTVIDGSMTTSVRLRVLEMEQSLRQIAEEEGTEQLPQWVATAARSTAGETLAYAVYDADGSRLSGNISAHPDPGVWMELSTRLETSSGEPASASPKRYLLHAVRIDGLTLVTGRSLEILSSVWGATLRGFVATALVVVLAMLAIGYLLSRRSQVKLERIEATLDRVAEGETGARIGSQGAGDQIDRISQRIDAHLDRLDRLVAGTRRTAASVAHDLRRPLARATLDLEKALARAESGQDPRAEIEDAQADLARLTAIVSTILRIARIEGGVGAALEPIDLRPLLDEIAETYHPVAEDAGQSLDYQCDGPLMLRGDADMLAQLVVNLMQNALSHAGSGARITLSARQLAQGVVICVSDTGPGIPEGFRQKVFEPFFRSDDARTVEGSGLGLPLVKAIAERHGAKVRLQDAAPGLRVSVSFPGIADL